MRQSIARQEWQLSGSQPSTTIVHFWPVAARGRQLSPEDRYRPSVPLANVGLAVRCGLASVIKGRGLSQFTVGDKVMLNPQ
jgi:hypothetical protein